MADSRDKPEIETLSYRNKECPAKPSSATLGFNSAIIKPETRVNKTENVDQALEPLEFPKMCKNTKKIIKACKQVIQSADDYDNDVMTTPITVVQACEQLNCLLETLKKEAEQGMVKMGFKDGKQPEQPNQNLMIIEEIEGLMSQVNDKLGELKALTFIVNTDSKKSIFKGPILISQALEEIDLFQKTTLFELRKAFE